MWLFFLSLPLKLEFLQDGPMVSKQCLIDGANIFKD